MSLATRALISATLAIALAGCAAAVPGYVPPSSKARSTDRVKAFESGEVSSAGTYEPSAAERALDCRRLTGSMHVIITRLKDAANRPQPSALTTGLETATTAVTGKPRRMDMTAEHQREEARLVAYNALLAEKKCPTIDLAAQGLPAKTDR